MTPYTAKPAGRQKRTALDFYDRRDGVPMGFGNR